MCRIKYEEPPRIADLILLLKKIEKREGNIKYQGDFSIIEFRSYSDPEILLEKQIFLGESNM